MEGAVKDTPGTTAGRFAAFAGPQDDFWNWDDELAGRVTEEAPFDKTEDMNGNQDLSGDDNGFNTIRDYLKKEDIPKEKQEYEYFSSKAYRAARRGNNTDPLIAVLRWKKVFEVENFPIAKFQQLMAKDSKNFMGSEFADGATIDKLLIDIKNRELYATTKLLKIKKLDYSGVDYRLVTDELLLTNFKMHTYFDKEGLHNISEENGKQKTENYWKKVGKDEPLKGVIEMQGDLDLKNLRYFSKGKDKNSPTSAIGFGKIIVNGLKIHIEHNFGKKKDFKLNAYIFAPIFTKILPNTVQLLATSFFKIKDHLNEKNTGKQTSLEEYNKLIEAYNYSNLNLEISFNDLVIEDLMYLADKNDFFEKNKLDSEQKTKHINKISLGQTKIGLKSAIDWQQENARFEKMQVAYFQRVRKEIEAIERESQVRFPLADTETLLLADPVLLAEIDNRLKRDAAHQLWKKITNPGQYEGLQLSVDTVLTELSGAGYLQNGINEAINTPDEKNINAAEEADTEKAKKKEFGGEIGLSPLQARKIHFESQLTFAGAVKDTILRLQGLSIPSVVVNHLYYKSADERFVLGRKKEDQGSAAPGSPKTANQVTLKNISADVDLTFSEEAGNAVPELIDLHCLHIGQIETGAIDLSYKDGDQYKAIVIPPLELTSVTAENIFLDTTKQGMDIIQPAEGSKQSKVGAGKIYLKQPYNYTATEKDPHAGIKSRIAATLDKITANSISLQFKSGGIISYHAGQVAIKGTGSYASGDTKVDVGAEGEFTDIEVEQDLENGLINIKKLGIQDIKVPNLDCVVGGYTFSSVNAKNAIRGVNLQGIIKLSPKPEKAEDVLTVTSLSVAEVVIFGLQVKDNKEGKLKIALPGNESASLHGIYLRNYAFPLSGNFWSRRSRLENAAIGAAGLNIPQIKAGILGEFSYHGGASTGAIRLNDGGDIEGLALVIQNPKIGLKYGIFDDFKGSIAFKNPKNFFEASELILHFKDLSIDLTNPVFHQLGINLGKESGDMSFVTDVRILGIAHYHEGDFKSFDPEPANAYVIESDAPVELSNFEWIMMKKQEKPVQTIWPAFDKLLLDIEEKYLKTEAISTQVVMPPVPAHPVEKKTSKENFDSLQLYLKKKEKKQPFYTPPYPEETLDTTKNPPYNPTVSIDFDLLTANNHPTDRERNEIYTAQDWSLWYEFISLHQKFDHSSLYLSPVKLKEEVEKARAKVKENAERKRAKIEAEAGKLQDAKHLSAAFEAVKNVNISPPVIFPSDLLTEEHYAPKGWNSLNNSLSSNPSFDNISPGVVTEKLKEIGAKIEAEEERARGVEQLSTALEAVKNVNGSIYLNGFNRSVVIKLDQGKVDIQDVIKSLSELVGSFLKDNKMIKQYLTDTDLKSLAAIGSVGADLAEWVVFDEADDLAKKLKIVLREVATENPAAQENLAKFISNLPSYVYVSVDPEDNFVKLYLKGNLLLFWDIKKALFPGYLINDGKVQVSDLIQYLIKDDAQAAPISYVKNETEESPIKQWFTEFRMRLIKSELSSLTIDLANIEKKPIEDYINYQLGKGLKAGEREFKFNPPKDRTHDSKWQMDYLKFKQAFQKNYLSPGASDTEESLVPLFNALNGVSALQEDSDFEEKITIQNLSTGDDLNLKVDMGRPIPGFTYTDQPKGFNMSLDAVQLSPFDFLSTKQFIQVKSPKGLKASGLKVAIKK